MTSGLYTRLRIYEMIFPLGWNILRAERIDSGLLPERGQKAVC